MIRGLTEAPLNRNKPLRRLIADTALRLARNDLVGAVCALGPTAHRRFISARLVLSADRASSTKALPPSYLTRALLAALRASTIC